MNKEDNKTLKSIADNLTQAADKFNDKEISDAAKKFADLVTAKVKKDSEEREKVNSKQKGRIKSRGMLNIVNATDNFVNNDKDDKHSVFSFLIDGTENIAMVRGNLQDVASLVAITMKENKEVKQLIYQAVAKYIAIS